MAIKGERIKQRRKQFRLSQEKLAERVGIDQTQISDYENDKGNPTAESLEALANALSTSVDYLLGRTDDPNGEITEGMLSEEEKQIVVAIRSGDRVQAAKLALGQ